MWGTPTMPRTTTTSVVRTLCTSVCIGGPVMGRANVYLPDDLERRVKAARIPVSEVCQQALLAAVEAAESGRPRLGEAVAGAYRQGAEAGEQWARAASPVTLLTL